MVLIGFFFKLSIIPSICGRRMFIRGHQLPLRLCWLWAPRQQVLPPLCGHCMWHSPCLGMYWLPLLAVLCAICMIFGNIMAMKQKDVKRMLAYSSIAQADI